MEGERRSVMRESVHGLWCHGIMVSPRSGYDTVSSDAISRCNAEVKDAEMD